MAQREDDEPKVVLITGASTGVGLALARKLWNSSYRVILTARESSLTRFPNPPFSDTSRFRIRPLDVTNDSERRALVEEIERDWGGVDVLINNAGLAYRSVVEHMSDDEELHQMSVNFFAPLALIRLVLPKMRERRAGQIINISSVGGMMAMPTMGSYSASKFALEGASEALWYELRPWNIRVTLVQPGFIHSGSFRNVAIPEPARRSMEGDDGYSTYYRHMSCFIEQLMNRTTATSESVADKVIDVMEMPRPPLRAPATFDAIFFSLLRRLLPRRMYHWLLYRNLPGIRTWGK